MKTIPYSKLLRKLADPEVPMAEFDPYITYEVDEKIGMEILIKPNWDYVTLSDSESQAFRTRGNIGLGFLNSVYRGRRRKTFKKRLKKGDKSKILLSEGDSWFQYPKFLKDTVDWLNEEFNIYSLGAAGDTLFNMLRKNEYWDHLDELGDDEITVHAMIISAGGNDIVADNLLEILNQNFEGANAQDLLNEDLVNAKFLQIRADYQSIFERLEQDERYKNLPVVFHGYGYAIPLPDQGSKIPPRDGWLGKQLRKKGILNSDLQKQIVRILIDRINDELSVLASDYSNAYFVDNRDAISPDLWHDELHPFSKGFEIVAGKFKTKLAEASVHP